VNRVGPSGAESRLNSKPWFDRISGTIVRPVPCPCRLRRAERREELVQLLHAIDRDLQRPLEVGPVGTRELRTVRQRRLEQRARRADGVVHLVRHPYQLLVRRFSDWRSSSVSSLEQEEAGAGAPQAPLLLDGGVDGSIHGLANVLGKLVATRTC
jgi:hypothetical protein